MTWRRFLVLLAGMPADSRLYQALHETSRDAVYSALGRPRPSRTISLDAFVAEGGI